MVKVGALIHVWDQVREKIKRERDPEPLWEVYSLHTHVHTYIHVCICIHIHIYIYTHKSVCMYIV